MVKKNIFITSNKAKNTREDASVSLSKSAITRRLHECKYRAFKISYKPVVTLKNKKARLVFSTEQIKSLQISGKNRLNGKT